MENDIKFLRIQNFKSIKDITLHPRRVNLIIGEPNVGKSNLLEAMTLLGGITYEQTEKFMGSFIRYEEPRQLFYDNLVGNTIRVTVDSLEGLIGFDEDNDRFWYSLIKYALPEEIRLPANNTVTNSELVKRPAKQTSGASNVEKVPPQKPIVPKQEIRSNIFFDEKGAYDLKLLKKLTNAEKLFLRSAFVRAYTFTKRHLVNRELSYTYLNPPHGSNLINVMQAWPELRREISKLFERYGQKLQLRMDERRLEIIKDQDGIIYSYPYSSVADTLQRIIFYLAAIESNDDAVLLFEEPEAHSFPVYVSKLGGRIVESRNNQFFIDTHSPYLITEILETMLPDDAQAGELAMFAAYYEDHQTKVHQLSDEEIRSIRADGIDVFYNMKRFTTGAADA